MYKLYSGKTVLERINAGLAISDPDAIAAKVIFDNFQSNWSGVAKNWKTGIDTHLVSNLGSAAAKFTKTKLVGAN
ncbi:hypothetical protein [Paenibacillus massiliensis]|uniref:hypothetical protein n=1 Tax=Paenibacillus massiliensis TaxID=225917 RepID=UPI0004901BDA|nr:hypothetical protein [Paenibacillus massiliensis]